MGYLEEEAVITYTDILELLDAGKLPMWSTMPAPRMAVGYWRLAENATMRNIPVLLIKETYTAFSFACVPTGYAALFVFLILYICYICVFFQYSISFIQTMTVPLKTGNKILCRK